MANPGVDRLSGIYWKNLSRYRLKFEGVLIYYNALRDNIEKIRTICNEEIELQCSYVM